MTLNNESTHQSISNEDERWLAFTEHYGDNIFHHPAWQKAIGDAYGFNGYVFIVEQEGRIRAGLPYFAARKRFSGLHWRSLPFTDHLTPVAESTEALEDLSVALSKVVGGEDDMHLEVRCKMTGDALIGIYVLYNGRIRGKEDIKRIGTV